MGPPTWFCCPAGICTLPEIGCISALAFGALPCAIAVAIAKAMAVVTNTWDILIHCQSSLMVFDWQHGKDKAQQSAARKSERTFQFVQ
ncbi:hypothetical protein J2W27_004515 [Variovorax boronicumulans]|uniref:hypothetical protein n=1 Tax=Variovorax boronicumulans TaxID=436515 RepID=UPI002786C78F|nr:hypothetical protein [Variovorax boronicumulans]MDP9912389.1 hypothetical protein [Variovorax boronicumulans]